MDAKLAEFMKSNSFEPSVATLRESGVKLGIPGAKKMLKSELIKAHSEYYSKWKADGQPEIDLGKTKAEPKPEAKAETTGKYKPDGSPKRAPSSWNVHCKEWANENGVSLSKALADKACRVAYHKSQYEQSLSQD